MPFQVPNLADVSYIDQAEPDAGDFRALGERGTGFLTGCLVTAQGTPALAVDHAAGTYVIAGTPYTKTSGSIAIVSGESNPRFDLVVGTATGIAVLKGVASSNPSFPSTFDPTVHCLFASVYVRQSVTSIAGGDVVDKRVSAPNTFNRVYTDTTTVAIAVTDSAAKVFSIKSSGVHTWVNSVLSRVSDAAMQFLTSLTLRPADTSLVNLILKARPSAPSTINVLEVQPDASGTALASISGTGVAQFNNMKRGAGNPNGSVVGSRGDFYCTNDFSDSNAAFWIKTTDATNTGWLALQTHDTTGAAVATGSIVAFPVVAGTTISGYGYCDGSNHSATDPVQLALYNFIGVTHGGSSGVNFNYPDYRGYSLVGSGGVLGLQPPTKVGETDGFVPITIGNMPPHNHVLNDAGHRHGFYGLPYTMREVSLPPTAYRVYPGEYPPVKGSNLPYMDVWPNNWPGDRAVTGLTMNNTGGGIPLDILGPLATVSYYIKL